MDPPREQQPNPEASSLLSGDPRQEVLTPSSVEQVDHRNGSQAGNCPAQPARTWGDTTLPIRDPTTRPELSIHEPETEEASRCSSSGLLMGRRSLSWDSLQQFPSEPDIQDDSHSDQYQVHQPSPRFWDPLWLRFRFLITYSCSLIVVNLAVLAIYIVSRNDDGLVLVSDGMGEVLAWKYLPTTGSYCLALHCYLKPDARDYSNRSSPILLEWCGLHSQAIPAVGFPKVGTESRGSHTVSGPCHAVTSQYHVEIFQNSRMDARGYNYLLSATG